MRIEMTGEDERKTFPACNQDGTVFSICILYKAQATKRIKIREERSNAVQG